MWNQKPSFRFEIDNFSEKKDRILSQTFVAGGYEWLKSALKARFVEPSLYDRKLMSTFNFYFKFFQAS